MHIEAGVSHVGYTFKEFHGSLSPLCADQDSADWGTTASLHWSLVLLECRALESYPSVPCAGEPGECSASGAG